MYNSCYFICLFVCVCHVVYLFWLSVLVFIFPLWTLGCTYLFLWSSVFLPVSSVIGKFSSTILLKILSEPFSWKFSTHGIFINHLIRRLDHFVISQRCLMVYSSDSLWSDLLMRLSTLCLIEHFNLVMVSVCLFSSVVYFI